MKKKSFGKVLDPRNFTPKSKSEPGKKPEQNVLMENFAEKVAEAPIRFQDFTDLNFFLGKESWRGGDSEGNFGLQKNSLSRLLKRGLYS